MPCDGPPRAGARYLGPVRCANFDASRR